MTAQNTALATVQPAMAPDVIMGFSNLQSFELMQRAAHLLASSTLVPPQYQSVIVKLDRFGKVEKRIENPNAIANAVVALNMSQRMDADPFMVMQNLHIIEGRPSWSSPWIIAAINTCGRFSSLQFDLEILGEKEVERVETFWENNQKKTRTIVVQVVDRVCVAWAMERETGARIESPAVSIEMAVKEGWYTKNGSKWQTIPELMLRYRAASFFGRLYAPELLMGMHTVEEAYERRVDIETEPTMDTIKPANRDLNARFGGKETIDMETGEIVPPPESNPTQPRNVDLKEQVSPSSNHVEKPEATQPEKQKSTTATAANKQEQPQQQPQQTPPPPEDPGPQDEPNGQTVDTAEKDQITNDIPPKVKAFMREINAATAGGSLAVDTWRMKHHNRVANGLGGVDSPLYKRVMEYADQTYKGMLEAEADQKKQGGKSNGSLF